MKRYCDNCRTMAEMVEITVREPVVVFVIGLREAPESGGLDVSWLECQRCGYQHYQPPPALAEQAAFGARMKKELHESMSRGAPESGWEDREPDPPDKYADPSDY